MKQFEYIRSDKKTLTVNGLKAFFDDGTFISDDNNLFSESEIKIIMNIIFTGSYAPQFGAIGLEDGNVKFISGKMRQVVNAAVAMANDAGSILSPLQKRRVHTTYLEFIVINEDYNKEMTHDDMKAYLSFFL